MARQMEVVLVRERWNDLPTLLALLQDATRAKRVWFALGELNRDELNDLDKATLCFNNALDLDWRFIEAFSAIEAMLGAGKRWQQLDENYKRMIARVPKAEDTQFHRFIPIIERCGTEIPISRIAGEDTYIPLGKAAYTALGMDPSPWDTAPRYPV